MTRQSKTTKLQREADLSKRMAEYLTKTGFRSLGDALAFYAGSAAPPRSEGMIEVETGTSTVNRTAVPTHRLRTYLIALVQRAMRNTTKRPRRILIGPTMAID